MVSPGERSQRGGSGSTRVKHDPPKPTHRAVCRLCRMEALGTLLQLAEWHGAHFKREHPEAGSVALVVRAVEG
jgi:hypothetical protein